MKHTPTHTPSNVMHHHQQDPALALYPPSYYPQYAQHLAHLAPYASSPSSQGSDSLGTPPAEPAHLTRKRPSSALSTTDPTPGPPKKLRNDPLDDTDDATSPGPERDEPKPKPTRGSRSVYPVPRMPSLIPLTHTEPAPSADDSR